MRARDVIVELSPSDLGSLMSLVAALNLRSSGLGHFPGWLASDD